MKWLGVRTIIAPTCGPAGICRERRATRGAVGERVEPAQSRPRSNSLN